MNTVFVYSATGNSLASAKLVAGHFGAQLVNISAENFASEYSGDIGVVVYPVYAYGMPMTVKRWIRHCNFNFKYFAVVTTCGSHSKGAFAEATRLFRRRHQRVHYSNEIKSVENYVHMFALPPEDQIREIIIRQRNLTTAVIADLDAQKHKHRFPIRPLCWFTLRIFRTFTATFCKRFRVTDKCNGCRVCYRVCPSKCITMVDTPSNGSVAQATTSPYAGRPCVRPSWNPKQCDHCQACLQLCPQRAICFGKITPDGRRYRNTDVTTAELFKRD